MCQLPLKTRPASLQAAQILLQSASATHHAWRGTSSWVVKADVSFEVNEVRFSDKSLNIFFFILSLLICTRHLAVSCILETARHSFSMPKSCTAQHAGHAPPVHLCDVYMACGFTVNSAHAVQTEHTFEKRSDSKSTLLWLLM